MIHKLPKFNAHKTAEKMTEKIQNGLPDDICVVQATLMTIISTVITVREDFSL